MAVKYFIFMNFRLKACIEPTSCKEGKITSVLVECDNNEEFIIANLNLKSFNESLDIAFNEGERICFKGNLKIPFLLLS